MESCVPYVYDNWFEMNVQEMWSEISDCCNKFDRGDVIIRFLTGTVQTEGLSCLGLLLSTVNTLLRKQRRDPQ